MPEATAAPLPDIAGRLIERIAIRAPSLIVTVWGDTIAAHGEAVWLGSLIRLMGDFGLNERVVRTSVFRLQKDNWLAREQIGRRSLYDLTPSARRISAAGDSRIYRPAPPEWRGEWLVLILGPSTAEVREKLRRELLLQGFGSPSPGVFVRPDGDFASARDLLEEFGVAEDVVAFHSDGALTDGLGPVRRMVAHAWDHAALEQGYREFIQLFRPVLAEAAGLDDRARFVVRTLLIHEFRRVTLRDPMLPAELLPADWPGQRARDLCAAIYRAIHAGAARHAMAVLETRAGRLPKPRAAYYDRFGGIDWENGDRQQAAARGGTDR
ncbi:phenylacetic acid degradation operon negative regulatory protein PaaX [Minwuia thermotolerans]|uniref:Phenylacetic acid degradation operon negative regulatory protein PaaX n=1 Tax=Minwuia thermotolerans TaxID=2056226 RepID=A0A2M9G7E7_9PROT|nr:phenylacetic acid degradation operon negative regulatory protein PaaX [Minwuia thermotolerans]PJK31630.1 phenylacetic acid degradation operon negative regulatory protein PaaX [Minwuia thermotolerans]